MRSLVKKEQGIKRIAPSALPQVLQLAGEHIAFSFFLLRTKKASEESWGLWVVLVTLALLRLWNSAHYLVHVLATAGPACFAALAAGYFLAHSYALSLESWPARQVR